jgi:pyruvate dehydrogenase E2 component (dihydrolipoamide acetyltransferase)
MGQALPDGISCRASPDQTLFGAESVIMEVVLPSLGDGIDSADVLNILVKEGDTVADNQDIIEFETDKATATVPSSGAGKITKIHVKVGDTVKVGAPLLTIEGAAAPDAPAKAPSAKPAATAPSKPAAAAKPAAPENPAPAQSAKSAPHQVSPETQPVAKLSDPAGVASEIIPAGPAVRRFAREVGVDLARLAGTGASGRITRDDVLGEVRRVNQGVQSGKSPSKTAAAPATPTDATGEDAWGPVRIEKMSKIRKTIAAKMHESWSSVPRVTNFDDADVTDLEKFRESSKGDYADAGIKLTTMPFVIKAVAMALRHHPAINASIDVAKEQLIYKQYINVGVAVDTDRGLVVPSLRNADELSIPEIAKALSKLAEAARTSSFSIDDLRGSTFTISNLGAIGGTYSTPIVNTPEVAILLLGRSRKMPVVVNDQVAIRLMMPLSLSYDHRLVDGGTAQRFLNDVMGFLKAPSRLLLAP